METIKKLCENKQDIEAQALKMSKPQQILVLAAHKAGMRIIEIFGLPGKVGLALCLHEELISQEMKKIEGSDEVN